MSDPDQELWEIHAQKVGGSRYLIVELREKDVFVVAMQNDKR